MIKQAAALFAVTMAFAAPVAAQDGITLQVKKGDVLTSTGGEFVSASSGKGLEAGEQILINAGSEAAADYGNGCVVTFSEPGVHTVPSECRKAAALPSRKGGTLLIAGGALALAAIIEATDGDGDDLSRGSR